jgi:hypothetical protein
MYKIILLKFENRKLKIENRIHNMISPIVGTTFARSFGPLTSLVSHDMISSFFFVSIYSNGRKSHKE